jgi:hypothetical protein
MSLVLKLVKQCLDASAGSLKGSLLYNSGSLPHIAKAKQS